MSGVSSQWLIDITAGITFSWINSSLSEPGSLFKVPKYVMIWDLNIFYLWSIL
jgi:hypothetical protein